MSSRVALIGLLSASQTSHAQSLREAAQGQMLIGTAAMASQLADPSMGGLVAREFDSLTAENEFKPQYLQRSPGVFDFAKADEFVAFAQAHQMKLIGHTLVWHNQSPRWLFADTEGKPLPREQGLSNLRQHIDAVAGHFKGKVVGWDVVNEAVPDGEGDLRKTPALASIGEDYIEKAFEFAHAADPDAELYYNDYGIERQPKLDKTLKIIRNLKAKGIRIDGVGIQGHWQLDFPSLQVIDEAIRAYQAEGLTVMITELDVDVLPRRNNTAEITATEREGADPYRDGLPDELQQKLAARYAELFRLFKSRGVTRVTIWGIHDGVSWLNNFPVRGRTNHALVFDRSLRAKPAHEAIIKVLNEKP